MFSKSKLAALLVAAAITAPSTTALQGAHAMSPGPSAFTSVDRQEATPAAARAIHDDPFFFDT